MILVDYLRELLSPLVDDQVWPDSTPDVPTFPLIIFQQVGGQAEWYVEGVRPDHKHARVQIVIWTKSRDETDALSDQLEEVLCASGLVVAPYGAAVSDYQDSRKLYGSRQDFGIWYPR